MNQMQNFSEQLVNEYSMMLLNWAYKKLCDKDKAEDLVQSVWLEVFRAVKSNESQGIPIEKPENFIWKIAHNVWCHYLRKNAKDQIYVSIDDMAIADETDFVQEMANSQETIQLLCFMRKKVMNLNYLQREIMISFYIEDRSIKEIASRLNITESTVKWHLFYTRKKLKEGIESMTTTNFVYRPHTLHMAINGQSHLPCDIDFIRNNLAKQNICIECYQTPKTLDQLSEKLGIPKAYLEFEVNWLLEREFLIKTSFGYSTVFMIETAQNEQEKYAVYLKHKNTLSDVIISELLAAEATIRSIDFYGCDKPINQLLWFLIYRFCDYLKKPCGEVVRPIRPDGGKYFPLGFDRSDYSAIPKNIDTTNWMYNGPMWSEASIGQFHWFGLYNFGQTDCQHIICYSLPEWKKMNEVLCLLIHSDFCIDAFNEDQLFILAQLIEKGFIKKENEKLLPTFCVFSPEQYSTLEKLIFKPLAQKLEHEVKSLADDLSELCKRKMPKQLGSYYDLFLRMALGDIGYITTILAFNDNNLYIPHTPEEGKLLTLFYVK